MELIQFLIGCFASSAGGLVFLAVSLPLGRTFGLNSSYVELCAIGSLVGGSRLLIYPLLPLFHFLHGRIATAQLLALQNQSSHFGSDRVGRGANFGDSQVRQGLAKAGDSR